MSPTEIEERERRRALNGIKAILRGASRRGGPGLACFPEGEQRKKQKTGQQEKTTPAFLGDTIVLLEIPDRRASQEAVSVRIRTPGACRPTGSCCKWS